MKRPMTTSQSQIYKEVARLLYSQMERHANDAQALEFLARITSSLVHLDKDYETKYDLGFMHQLSITIGLLEDAPEMGIEASRDLKASDYPDIFKD